MWCWASIVFGGGNHLPYLTYVNLQLSWSVANLHIQRDAIPCGMEYYAISKHSLRPTAVHAYNPRRWLAVPTAALSMKVIDFGTFKVYK